MQWNVGARPSVLSRRKVVGVGFAGHFKHNRFNAFRHRVVGSEPFGISPRLQNRFSVLVARISFRRHIMKGIENQCGGLQFCSRGCGQFIVVQQFDQGFDIVAAVHIAQQFYRCRTINDG